MQMRMDGQRLAPGMQRHQQAWQRTQILLITQQFHQRITGRPEQQIREVFLVITPQNVQLLGEREDHVVMVSTSKKIDVESASFEQVI